METTPPLSYQRPSEWNRRIVIELLRKHQTLSRRQIAEVTGLKGSTLTYIVRDLLDQKMVRTAGRRSSGSVGAKQILLEINPELGVAVGFELRGSSALMVICNAIGEVLDATEIPTERQLHQVPRLLRDALDRRLAELGWASTRPILGVGVGVPGAVDAHHGVIVHSIPFNVQNFPLRQVMSLSFDTPVIAIDHDANYAALAEARVGKAQQMRGFVYFLINYDRAQPRAKFKAFGTALFLSGQIYHGHHSSAGELNANLAPKVKGDLQDEDWQCLKETDAELTPFLRHMAEEVGVSISSIVSLLDPQAVIIGNSHWVANEQFARAVERAVQHNVAVDEQRRMVVQYSSIGHQAVALGAAVAALDEAMNDVGAASATAPTSLMAD